MNHDDATPQVQKSEEEWKAELGPERYHILREAGTEAPFTGPLLNVSADGTYTCGGCGQPLSMPLITGLFRSSASCRS